jgi:hypothetical protein
MSATAHDDEEEYSSESSLTTWEASFDEDGPISSSDYAAGVGAGGGDVADAAPVSASRTPGREAR